jgi:hypothetical protein
MIDSKFKVGQVVYLKQDIEYNKNNSAVMKLPTHPLIIIEIMHKVCYAGTQTFYTVRMYNKDGVNNYINFNEIELTDILE